MKKIILINAIVWAILILVSSYLFKGHENWNYFFAFLLVTFSLINGYLASKLAKQKKDCSRLK